MFESTAVWSEEQVFPDDDDWLFYLDAWKRTPQQPITKFGAGGGLQVYGSAVWNHWLDLGRRLRARRDPRRVAAVAADRPRRTSRSAAYDRAIKRNGGEGFAQEFGRFAAATAEWQVERTGISPATTPNEPDETQFPDVDRDGKLLDPAATGKRFKLDHTAYRLLRTSTPVHARRLKLKVRRPATCAPRSRSWDATAARTAATSTSELKYRAGRRLTARDARRRPGLRAASRRWSQTPTVASAAARATTGTTRGTTSASASACAAAARRSPAAP